MASDPASVGHNEVEVSEASAVGDTSPMADSLASRRAQVWLIVGAVALLVLVVGAVVLMARFPAATQVVRDIAIVFVAVTTLLIGLAMLLLIFQIQVLIQVLREEIQPLLRSVNDTVSTVRGTTEFMSQNVVTPVIQAASFTAGMRRMVRDILGVAGAMRSRSGHGNRRE
ncbi:MAG TPA: hypothetical protein ENL34_10620 [Chloroflexi bacterium]|nr:hypothetical protein [Chloroflexota bacterium]